MSSFFCKVSLRIGNYNDKKEWNLLVCVQLKEENVYGKIYTISKKNY